MGHECSLWSVLMNLKHAPYPFVPSEVETRLRGGGRREDHVPCRNRDKIHRVVDYRACRPYLGPMANRLILTLLALLTGLAAQIGPAEARASQVASMQVGAVVETVSARASRAPVALARLPEPGLRNARRHAPAFVRVDPFAVVVPAVLPGIDRARE
jgi:hypothetical protein